MAEIVVVDAGPLVAMLRQDDIHHQRCRDVASQLRSPLITTWPAVTEAAWLLRHVPGGVSQLVGFLESGLVRCHDLEAAFPFWLQQFLRQYADLAPQLADASLAYTADVLKTDTILTLDRRDFSVIRNRHGKPYRLLPETL
jgi:hypothetical protein